MVYYISGNHSNHSLLQLCIQKQPLRQSMQVLHRLMQAALPHLKKSKGTIINMSSMMSQINKTAQMAYSASKSIEDAVGRSSCLCHQINTLAMSLHLPCHVPTDVSFTFEAGKLGLQY